MLLWVNLIKKFILKFNSAHAHYKDVDCIFEAGHPSCQSRKINETSICLSCLLVIPATIFRYHCNRIPVASKTIAWKGDDIDRIRIFSYSSTLFLHALNSLKNFISQIYLIHCMRICNWVHFVILKVFLEKFAELLYIIMWFFEWIVVFVLQLFITIDSNVETLAHVGVFNRFWRFHLNINY